MFKNWILAGFIWISQGFNFFDDAMKFMNGLPENQRESAYIVAFNSHRSSVFFGGYYAVVYKEFK